MVLLLMMSRLMAVEEFKIRGYERNFFPSQLGPCLLRVGMKTASRSDTTFPPIRQDRK